MKIGFIGSGTITRHHVRASDELGCSISGVYDVSEEMARDFAEANK